jgi:hypothetical protein
MESVAEAFTVALEHFDEREEVMGEVNRLGALEMGVTGDENGGVFAAEFDEDVLELADLAFETDDFVAEPHPEVHGDLVIAGASGVKFGAGGDTARELGLDVHVDILEFGAPLEAISRDLLTDVIESLDDGHLFVTGEDADLAEHGGVGDGAEDVLPPEAPVEGDGFGEGGDGIVGTGGEPAAAGNG